MSIQRYVAPISELDPSPMQLPGNIVEMVTYADHIAEIRSERHNQIALWTVAMLDTQVKTRSDVVDECIATVTALLVEWETLPETIDKVVTALEGLAGDGVSDEHA